MLTPPVSPDHATVALGGQMSAMTGVAAAKPAPYRRIKGAPDVPLGRVDVLIG